MLKFQTEFFGKSEDGKITDVILAVAGPAKGHKGLKGYQLFADEATLEIWANLGNEKGRIPATTDHEHKVGSKIGWFSNFRVKGSVLIADLELSPVAFTRSTGFVGEYIKGIIDSEDTEFAMVSVESDIPMDDCKFDNEKRRIYMRPKTLEVASFVFSGALTEKIFSRMEENQMKDENTDEEMKQVALSSEEEKEKERVQEELESEETETETETEETTYEESTEVEDKEEMEDEVEEEEKESEEEEMEDDEGKEEKEELESEETDGPATASSVAEIKSMLSQLLEMLTPQPEEELSEDQNEKDNVELAEKPTKTVILQFNEDEGQSEEEEERIEFSKLKDPTYFNWAVDTFGWEAVEKAK